MCAVNLIEEPLTANHPCIIYVKIKKTTRKNHYLTLALCSRAWFLFHGTCPCFKNFWINSVVVFDYKQVDKLVVSNKSQVKVYTKSSPHEVRVLLSKGPASESSWTTLYNLEVDAIIMNMSLNIHHHHHHH